MKNYYWFRLLSSFEAKCYFFNGLTLPFIIGARLYIEPSEQLLTIRAFFNEIQESPHLVNVLACYDIGEYVFRISNGHEQQMYGGLDNLTIVDSFEELSDDEGLVTVMEDRYLHLLAGGKYSKTDGHWGDFTEADKTRLAEVRNSY